MTTRTARLLVCTTLGLVTLSSRSGLAQWAVGIDGNAGRSERGTWGGGGDARFGYRTGLPRSWIVHTIILQPEAILGYHLQPLSGDAVCLVRLGGGGRIGLLLGYFEPFGYGHVNLAIADGYWGNLLDAGAALDFRLPTSSLGFHYTHGWLHTPHEDVELDEFGLHLEIRGFWF